MTLDGSNRLADLADRIGAATRASAAASLEAARHALDAGRLLLDAREECPHGRWLPFLERAGVAERQAQRLMQLARSGLKSDTVSDLGGVKAALAFLAVRRLPAEGEVLLADPDPNHERPERIGVVWEDRRGFYHVASLHPDGDPCVTRTERPVSGEPVRLDDGSFVNGVWDTLAAAMGRPLHRVAFTAMPERLSPETLAAIGLPSRTASH